MNMLRWTNLYGMVLRAPDEGGGAAASGGDAGSAGSVAPDSGGAAADGGGSDSGRSAPDSAPAASGPSGPDWSQLGSGEDLDYVEVQPQSPIQEPPVVPKAPQVEAPKPAPVQAAPVQTTPAASEGETSRPALSASDPMGIASGLEANRDAVLAHLAQTKFALTEQDIQELETDVVAAVPRIMSRVFFESQVSMQKFLAQAVPGMVKQFNTVSSANDAAEKQFFSAHPALDINNPQHRATAVRIASVYRQANPNIPVQQLIAEVGPMVMTALQINAAARPGGRPSQPKAAGFVPAVNGGGGYSPAAQPEGEWAGLGRDYD